MKYKKRYIFLGILLVLWCTWMWMVGFHTGKYSRQETPFNVPMRIIRGAIDGATTKEKKLEMEANFEKLKIGQPAPEFKLPGLKEGEMVELSDFKNKTVLLEFWASWCGDCRRSNSYLWDLYEKHQGENFEIISISMDRSFRAWKKAIQKDNMNWPQVCDGKGANSDVMLNYGVYSLPQNFLLDKKNKIVGKDMNIKAIKTWLDQNL